jgi:hypothetical protein
MCVICIYDFISIYFNKPTHKDKPKYRNVDESDIIIRNKSNIPTYTIQYVYNEPYLYDLSCVQSFDTYEDAFNSARTILLTHDVTFM